MNAYNEIIQKYIPVPPEFSNPEIVESQEQQSSSATFSQGQVLTACRILHCVTFSNINDSNGDNDINGDNDDNDVANKANMEANHGHGHMVAISIRVVYMSNIQQGCKIVPIIFHFLILHHQTISFRLTNQWLKFKHSFFVREERKNEGMEREREWEEIWDEKRKIIDRSHTVVE